MSDPFERLFLEVQGALRPESLRAVDPDVAGRLAAIEAAGAFLLGHLGAVATPDPQARQAAVSDLQAAWGEAAAHRAALRDAAAILDAAGPAGPQLSALLRALTTALDGPALSEAALGDALEAPLEAARQVGQEVRERAVAQQIRASVDHHLAGFTLPFRGTR